MISFFFIAAYDVLRAPVSSRVGRLRRWSRYLIVTAFAVSAGGIFLGSQVPQELTKADRLALDSFAVSSLCRQARGNYTAEIGCLQALAAELAQRVPDDHCVHDWGRVSHEPADVLARRRGCCYSRSRVIEKALVDYGFEVRHVSVFAGGLPWYAYAGAGVSSHSTSEVRSARGWLLIDSSMPSFLAVDAAGNPHSARDLRDMKAEQQLGQTGLSELPPSLMDANYVLVYGMYSRHGGFFAPFVPLPDMDWRMFLYNLLPD